MRTLLLATLACLALPLAAEARPLRVHVRTSAAGAILVREGILTPAQLACSLLQPGRHGSGRVEHVKLFERHGEGCPGAPQPPTFLFDVYVDLVSGVVDYTPEGADELKTIVPLPRANAAFVPG